MAISGQSLLLNANAPNFGSMYVMLDEFHHRRKPELSGDAIAAEAPGDAAGRGRPTASSTSSARPPSRASARPAASRSSSRTAATPAWRRSRRSPRRSWPTASDTPGLQRPLLQLPGQHAVALPEHRPRPRQDDGRLDDRGLRDLAGLPRFALHQRLQPLRPHLAGERPGRGELPEADRGPQAAQDPQRPRRDGPAGLDGQHPGRQRPGPRDALQYVHVGGHQRRARAGDQLRPGASA